MDMLTLPLTVPDGPALLTARPMLQRLLSGLLLLSFTPTDRRNLGRCFYLTDAGLEAALRAYEHATYSDAA